MTSRLSKLAGFVMHYGREISAVAGILRTVAGGIGLDPREREAVAETLDRLEGVQERIMAGIDALSQATEIKVSKADIKNTVKELLPEIIAGVVREMAKPNKQPGV